MYNYEVPQTRYIFRSDWQQFPHNGYLHMFLTQSSKVVQSKYTIKTSGDTLANMGGLYSSLFAIVSFFIS